VYFCVQRFEEREVIVSFVDTCIVGIDDHRETHRDNFVMLSASNKERARVVQ
jgi:hypothetical protein